ncbi:rangrf [Symbiodinium sp. CCMP2592]|nr:rangrf [Symbiodinium sp. CCMP2592]
MEVPHLPATARCLAGIGEQTVAKFREDRGNRVRIHAAAIRLPDVSTDILITLNDPVHVDPDSSSAEAPVPSEPAEDVFRMLLRSFRITDWGLFGEG